MPRLLEIVSPLGKDKLIATHFRSSERLGLPYSVEIQVLSDNPELRPADLLTKPVTLSVNEKPNGAAIVRHFHGLVAELGRLGPGPSLYTIYRLVLVPGIWKLSLRQNCRIFQEKSVKDIVTAVLSEHGEPSPQWGITPALAPIPYCTQFNETDLQFVSRLLEEHGLTYYFSHTAMAHSLHISATAAGFPAFVGGDVKAVHNSLDFFELSGWRRLNRVRSKKTVFDDMDVERNQPSVVLNKTSATRTYAGEPAMWDHGEVFHWPGGMSTRPGLDNAAVAMGAMEAMSEEFEASALDPRFSAGTRVIVAVQTVGGQPISSPYVVTTARHEAADGSNLSSGGGDTQTSSSALTFAATGRTWMPTPTHPRPVMSGLYSAKVMGPAGEKIHVDEFGRVKVKFRWDRATPDDDTTSCWVRVAQAAAGAWGGTWFLPRVGDEVLVAFLDGDPDRPVVTGSVYSKDAKPPFQPGSNRAQSGIKTRSYKSDSADDANVLRFEDKKNAEEVLLHAQKDLTVEVENDEKRTVDHDQIETIKNSRTTTIKEADDTYTLETGKRTQTIKTGDDSYELATGNRTEIIKTGNDTYALNTGNRSATLKMGDETVTLNMGNESHAIKLGNMTVKCDLGGITLEAMQKITLKVGPTTAIELTPAGITLKGVLITSEAKAVHQTKGAIVQIDGQGPVMMNGAIVMIN